MREVGTASNASYSLLPTATTEGTSTFAENTGSTLLTEQRRPTGDDRSLHGMYHMPLYENSTAANRYEAVA